MSGKKIGIFLIIGIFIMISVVGVECVFAQKGSEIPAKQNVAGSEVEGASQSADDVMMSDGGEVSLDFREADIRNVLKILAFKSGINIVTSPEVVGVVTIQLKDVPWKQALEVILQTYGYAYDQKGNIIVVTTIEDMKKRREDSLLLAEQEPLETEIFMLNFGRASEIVESLEKMKSERGNVNFDERTNTLIVTDTASKLVLIAKVIKGLDATTPQVLIESKIIETVLDDSEQLGIEWTTQASVTGSSITHTFPFAPPVIDNKYINPNIDTGGVTSTASAITNGTLSFANLQAVFRMLAERTDTNILSNPRIVTLDNHEARIDVGTEHPYPLKFFNDETGSWQLSGWEYKKIGIVLKVTPHVSLAAGIITLDVEPSITDNLGDVTDAASGSAVPKLSIEQASTKVMVKDGETLVIGGLVKDKAVDVKKKVPFLGDIPILGKLFTKTSKDVDKTDLLIFITPTIITPEVSSEL